MLHFKRYIPFFFVQAYRLSAYTLKYKTWKKVVEGQGAHPQASGLRKQVWVCCAEFDRYIPMHPVCCAERPVRVQTMFVLHVCECWT